MAKIKILAIAPYPGLKEVISSVAKERNDIIVQTYVGNLSDGANIVKDLHEKDYDVIISRGGTSMLVEQVTDIPIVDLEVTAYDMIRIMKISESIYQKTAIVGFPNIANCARIVSELLNYPIDVYTIEEDDDVGELLNNLMKQGYSMFIGDVVTWEIAKKMGVTSVLMTSGTECVRNAFDEAAKIYKYLEKSKKEISLYKKIIESGRDYVTVINTEGKILFTNIPEENTADQEMLEEMLKHWHAKSENEGFDFEIKHGDFIWSIAVSLNEFGDSRLIIFNIHSSQLVKEWDNDAVKIWGKESDANSSIHLFIGEDQLSRTIADQIECYSKVDIPILLIGEYGVGKSSIAYEIYKRSNQKDRLFIKIDCEKITNENVEQIFSLNNSEFSGVNGATLFLQDIHKFEFGVQKKVFQFLSAIKFSSQFRIISATTENLETIANKGEFSKKLLKLVSELQIFLPPLRERKHDFPGIASIIISEYNMKYGKQVAGFQHGAFEAAYQYSWPGNIEQLRRVLCELVLKCSGSYITAGDIEYAIEKEKNISVMGNARTLSLDGTLDEITGEVVRKVLEEEQMNQSKAAKRLGISRSTLWRKLKMY